jgi:hypothetical protein
MITIEGIEQFIPFIKPLFDGLRSARDLFKRDQNRTSERDIDIPKKTLILLPDIHMNALWWGLGSAGSKQGMQITGRLQATNTSKFHIRAAGIKLLMPADVEVIMQTVSVKDAESGMHSFEHLIPVRSIAELSFMFFVVPVTGRLGKPLNGAISIQDQFGNEHVVKNLMFKWLGPQPSPDDQTA